ncbi:superoxide dismutase [Devosia sp. BK]|uniref:superoxide dismutase n=1 Tax=Devosia sp. BK TaxID=2871706 RepID=UPI00293AA4CD|nr:superoxide dismutase [Devosia sp. BK]MDV3251005.1 superoxide dismutase [Devosia sp. BK]
MQVLTRSLTVAAIAFAPLPALAQTTSPFTLPDLPYEYGALEPAISTETMELHHGKHHQTYVDKLNEAIEGGDAPATATLEELVGAAGTYPPAIRNNAGGHWNHTFFWETMAPADAVGEASADLTAAIETVYGSMDDFKTEFEAKGAAQFGSGWVWLIVTEAGQLEITSTPNQDNPLMDVAEVKGTPILGNDVWEHAYYLTYNNRRAEYLSAWWDVVNWSEVSERYQDALAQ